MTKQKLNNIGYLTAAMTFAIASIIMYAHFQGFKGDYEAYGLLFIPIAFLVNLCVLIFIFVTANRRGIKGSFWSIYLMFLNIPVAFFYLWFAIYLMGYYRVTIINNTSSNITDIHLSGCDNKSVKELVAGEKETVWIEIKSDCSLSILYIDAGKNANQDVVEGYLCSGMGQHADYYISGKDNPKY
ncbi:MAG: hypothetical protein V4622_01030 [Bacteroidota bacterium]